MKLFNRTSYIGGTLTLLWCALLVLPVGLWAQDLSFPPNETRTEAAKPVSEYDIGEDDLIREGLAGGFKPGRRRGYCGSRIL